MENTVILARKIADFISEHGDEDYIKEQMEDDETRDEYIDRLGDETAEALEHYDDASAILAYLAKHLHNSDTSPDTNSDTKQAAKELMDSIQETYAFKLGNIAHKYTAVELDTESPDVLNDMKAEMDATPNDENSFAQFVHELNKINEQLLDTPDGRADMLQKAETFTMKLESHPERFDEHITGFIKHLEKDIAGLGEETEAEYIARKASGLINETSDFWNNVRDNFDDVNVRNALVGHLEAIAGFSVESAAGCSGKKLVHADNEQAETAARLISRICDYEKDERICDYDDNRFEGWEDIMQAMIQTVMYAPVGDDSGGRSFYSIYELQAVKNIDAENGDTSIRLFDSNSQFAEIRIDDKNKKADVTFLDHNILDDKRIAEVADMLSYYLKVDDKRIAEVTDVVSYYLKEPQYHTEFHYPDNHISIEVMAFTPTDDKDFAIAEMDERSLAECLDRILPTLASKNVNFMFYDGKEFMEDYSDSIETFVNISTEQLYVGVEDNGKRYEQEVLLTPDERSLVTARLDEYEAGKGKEDIE